MARSISASWRTGRPEAAFSTGRLAEQQRMRLAARARSWKAPGPSSTAPDGTPGADRPGRRRRRRAWARGAARAPRRATTTGRSPRASAPAARATRRARSARSRRRRACAAGSAGSSARRRTTDGRGAEGRALLARWSRLGGEFAASDEVDAAALGRCRDRASLLSYGRDDACCATRSAIGGEPLWRAAARTPPSRMPPAPSRNGTASRRCTSARMIVPASSVSARCGAIRKRDATSSRRRDGEDLDRALELVRAQLGADDLRHRPRAAADGQRRLRGGRREPVQRALDLHARGLDAGLVRRVAGERAPCQPQRADVERACPGYAAVRCADDHLGRAAPDVAHGDALRQLAAAVDARRRSRARPPARRSGAAPARRSRARASRRSRAGPRSAVPAT